MEYDMHIFMNST